MRSFVAFTLTEKHRLNVLKTPVTVSTDTKINPKSHKKSFVAIWDTGATSSVISKRVAKEMNLTPIGKTVVSTANGMAEVSKYIVTLELPNHLVINDIEVAEGNLGTNTDLLIGMDIITLGDFSITNVNNCTTFTFRFPSCNKIDYVEDARNLKITDLNKLKRKMENNIKKDGNRKCPCGSGKKYRYCCGKEKIQQAKKRIGKNESIKLNNTLNPRLNCLGCFLL